jgi:CRISPR/Cas system-associated exonuclease Cas4 (RecB family)
MEVSADGAPVDDLLTTILDDIANSTPSDLPKLPHAAIQRPGIAADRKGGARAAVPPSKATADQTAAKSRSEAVLSVEEPGEAPRLWLDAQIDSRSQPASSAERAEQAARMSPPGVEHAIEPPRQGDATPAMGGGSGSTPAPPLAVYPSHVTGALVLEVQHRSDGVWLVLDPDGGLGAAEPGSAALPGLHLCLRDEWANTPARAGDRVHLIGKAQGCGCAGTIHQACGILSRWCGLLLVLRPETLVTGTQISSSCSCPRKAALSRMRRGGVDASMQLVLGSMKHEIFEHLLASRQDAGGGTACAPAPPLAAALGTSAAAPLVPASRDELVRRVLRKHLPELLALMHDDRAAATELRQAYDGMAAWVRDFVPERAGSHPPAPLAAGGPRAPALASHGGGGEAVCLDEHGGQLRRAMAGFEGDAEAAEARGLPHSLRVRGVAATEFNLTSLPYGLKGTIDAVLEVDLLHADGAVLASMPVPFELKTGKRSSAAMIDHQAQLLVYTLLMAEHNAAHVPVGLLLYSQFATAERRGVSAVHADPAMLESLVMQRNTIVAGCAPRAIEDGRMPPMLGDERTCGGCFERQHCFLAHATLEGGSAHSSGAAHLPRPYTLRFSLGPPAHSCERTLEAWAQD